MGDQVQELSDLLNTHVLTCKDRFGKEHKLQALDLVDLSDMMRHFGGDLESLQKRGFAVDDLFYILWLSFRKEGLSQDEIDQGKWKIMPQQVGRMFTAKDLSRLNELILQLYKISGLEMKPPEKVSRFEPPASFGKKNQEETTKLGADVPDAQAAELQSRGDSAQHTSTDSASAGDDGERTTGGQERDG